MRTLTELMRLVAALDHLLEKKIEVREKDRRTKAQQTFQASSRSAGKITYRFFRTAIQLLYREKLKRRGRRYLANQPPGKWKRFPQRISGLDEIHLYTRGNEFKSTPNMKDHPQSSRSTSGPRFILPVTVWKTSRFSLLDGYGNSIFRSRRPGRSKAGSKVSARLVAIITYARSLSDVRQ